MKSSAANPTAIPDLAARIFNIQRYSTDDGPGIRTTVFMKGCPMSCLWCHNPESMRRESELIWHPERCIGHRECIEVCPNGALSLGAGGEIVIDRERCQARGNCIEVCPTGALEIFGAEMSIDEVMKEVEADRVYYETSGGGVTFSGGEPFHQRDFLIHALAAAKAAGISTAVDTTALAPREAIAHAAEHTDLFLVDLKSMDPENHQEWTGAPLQTVLDNILYIDGELKKPIWVRTPLIPGHTGTKENVRATAEFIRDRLTCVERYDLLAYSNLAGAKYKALSRDWKMDGAELYSRGEADGFAEAAREVLPPEMVHISGPMRAPESSEPHEKEGEGAQ